MAIVRRTYSAWGNKISTNIIETTMKNQLAKLKKQHKNKPECIQTIPIVGKSTIGSIIVKTDDGMKTEYTRY